MITCFYSRDDKIYTVGAEHHDGSWCPLRDCSSQEEAMAWISYLNGGAHPEVIIALREDRQREPPPKFVPLSSKRK